MGNNQNRQSRNRQNAMDESERICFSKLELPVPELLNSSAILEKSHVEKLYVLMPARVVGHNWIKLFSTEENGFTLRSLYKNMESCDTPVLLVIRDAEGAVFGAMLTEAFRQTRRFYGGGESFLYTFHPEFKVFKSTGRNTYFIMGNTDSIAIGAGNGSFGLWFDADLNRGRSEKCFTFDNDILSKSEDFLITSLEIWGFEMLSVGAPALPKG